MNKYKFVFNMVISVVFSLIPLWLGYDLIGVVLCATTISAYIAANGIVFGIASALLAALATMFVAGGIKGAFYGLIVAISALCTGLSIKNKRPFSHIMGMTLLGYLVPTMLYFSYLANDMGVKIIELLVDIPMKESGVLLKSAFAQTYPELDTAIVEGIIEKTVTTSKMILPSVLILSAIFVSYIMVWFTLLKFRKSELKNSHSFRNIKVSGAGVLVTIVTFVMLFAVKEESIKILVLNLLIIEAFFYFAGAISLIDFYFSKSRINTFFRVALYCIVLFFLMTTGTVLPVSPIFLLPVTGFVDSVVDFRKRSIRKNEEKVQ